MLIWTRRLTLCCCLGSIVRLLSWENPAETQVASWLVSLEKQDEVNLHFKRLDEMEMGWGETEFLSPANKPQTVLRAGRPFPATVEGGGGMSGNLNYYKLPCQKTVEWEKEKAAA